MQRKKIITIVGLYLMIFCFIGLYYFIFVNNRKVNPIIKQIENFSLYQEINDQAKKYLGEDCANEEFNQFKKIVEQGSLKQLILPGGFEVIITPNYNHWSNEKFLSFLTAQPEAFCAAGGVYPLHAYKDKLLWAGSCSTGRMLEVEDPGYAEFVKCTATEEIINNYFKK